MLSNNKSPYSLSKLFTKLVIVKFVIVLGAVVFLFYYFLINFIGKEESEHIVKYVEAKADKENNIFKAARINHKLLKDEFQNVYNTNILKSEKALKLEFDKLLVRSKDGAIRNESTDTTHAPGIFIPKYINLTDVQRDLIMHLYKRLKDAGPGSTNLFVDTWLVTKDGINLIYWPTLPKYVFDTPADFMHTDQVWYKVATENNPNWETKWTDTYYDPNAKVWMVTASTPIVQNGVCEVVLGHDISIEQLFKSAIKGNVENSYNFILSSEGKLIAHPNHQGQLEKAGTSIGIDQVDDEIISKSFKYIKENFSKGPQHSQSFILKGEETVIVGVAKIPETGWYFISVHKRHFVKEIHDLMILLTLISFIATLVLIYIFNTIYKKVLFLPLQNIINGIEKIKDGDLKSTIDIEVKNELKDIAESVNAMAWNLDQRERAKNEAMVSLEEQKQLAKRADEVKSKFLANMSHEIRTPINGIIGVLQAIQDTDLNIEQKELFSIMEESASTLNVIINDILDLTKIESDKIELELLPIKLSKLVTGLENAIKFDCGRRDIKLVVEILGNKETIFKGDPTRIKQVLLNLLGNAVKFTPNGGQVAFKTGVFPTENVNHINLFFEVIDNGIGISEEQLSKLFQPFVQSDSSTTRKYGGSGLGLVISKKLVELMGGKLSVKSKIKQGSIFRVELLLESVSEEVRINNTEEIVKGLESELMSKAKDKVILIVEDNSINQKIVCKIIQKFGCKVFLAENGEVALNLIRINKFDVIFMDCQMPVMDGYVATRIIRSDPDPQISKVKIIALTANVMSGDIKACKEAGMDSFVGKPVMKNKLYIELLSALEC